MDDWDFYSLSNKLDGIRGAQERTNHELETLNRRGTSQHSRDRIFSQKTKIKIVIGIILGLVVFGALIKLGFIIFCIFYF